MKLLFLNAVGVIGGAERVLISILSNLKTHCPNLHLILIVLTDGALIETAEKIGVEVIYLPLPQSINRLGDSGFKTRFRVLSKLNLLFQMGQSVPSLLGYLRQLKHTIQQLQPDLIHSNSIKTHLLLAFLRKVKCPIVWHIHDFYGTRPLVATLLKWAKRSATSAISISTAIATDAEALLNPLPIHTIYNTVDLNYFVPSSIEQHNSDCLNIGLVATFARWKGHEIFLQAAAQVMAAIGDIPVRFQIIGGPIYQTQGSQFSIEELQEIVKQLDLEPVVDFLGFQKEMVTVYQGLDIVVHASTQPEPFGLVILEAMACGKPVIVSCAGGAAELFTPHHDAIGVPPNDAPALAHALIELICDRNQRQRLGQHARETIEQRYRPEQQIEAIATVFQSLIHREFTQDQEFCLFVKSK